MVKDIQNRKKKLRNSRSRHVTPRQQKEEQRAEMICI